MLCISILLWLLVLYVWLVGSFFFFFEGKGQLQITKFMLGSEAEGNKEKEMNKLLFPESQCDYFCFIARSLRAKYEF